MTENTSPRRRIRITFAKGEEIKYISHLDLNRTWERAFRRAGLPLAYSQGFNPRPRFQMAAALPVGVSGQAELLDIWLVDCLDPDAVLDRLRPVLPRGLEVLDAVEADLGAPSLQSRMRAADYQAVIRSREPVAAMRARVQALLGMPSIPRQRHHKGKLQSYDLRPFIQKLTVEPGQEGTQILLMRLQASPQGAGRPDEILDVLGLSLCPHLVQRTNLCLEFDK